MKLDDTFEYAEAKINGIIGMVEIEMFEALEYYGPKKIRAVIAGRLAPYKAKVALGSVEFGDHLMVAMYELFLNTPELR